MTEFRTPEDILEGAIYIPGSDLRVGDVWVHEGTHLDRTIRPGLMILQNRLVQSIKPGKNESVVASWLDGDDPWWEVLYFAETIRVIRDEDGIPL